jgi:hypothetical protein
MEAGPSLKGEGLGIVTIPQQDWADRPFCPDVPQAGRGRADREVVEFAAVLVRPRRAGPVTRKILALLGAGLLIVGLSACMTTEEAAVFTRLNAVRAQAGQPALLPDEELVAKAQAQSQVMAGQGTLFHSTLRDGVTGAPRRMGENVAVAGSIDRAFQALVDSPPQYANMVDGSFNRVGVGIFQGADGRVWVTMVFAQR